MAKKIAQVDNDAMNSLFASEVSRMSGKTAAAEGHGGKEEVGGISHDPQAFKDHEEYLEILQSAMSADEKSGGDPNDPLKD
jgi:hypothetical protein